MNDSVLEIAERHSQAAALFSLAGLEDARKRAHTLLVLLMAGGSGLAGVGLARWADTPALAVAALAGAAWWFALAACFLHGLHRRDYIAIGQKNVLPWGC